jgi:hypothetical protein
MGGGLQYIELIVHEDTRPALAEGEDESLVESWLDVAMGFCSVTLVDIHGEGVELFETSEMLDEEDDQTSTLDCLYCSTKDIWS